MAYERLRRTPLLPLLLLPLLVLALWSCAQVIPSRANPDNLLSSRVARQATGISRADRLTDEKSVPPGDFWNTAGSALLSGPRAYADWDLGKETPVQAAWLQGDNNDTYILSISDDGVSYRPLWRAGPVGEPGMRARSVDNLQGKGRFLRVTVEGGDGSYALSEVQAFAARPAQFPPSITIVHARPPSEELRTNLLFFGLAMAFALFASKHTARWYWTVVAVAPAAASAVLLGLSLFVAWPAAARDIALLRGVSAAVAAVAVLREVWAPPKFLANRAVVIGMLAVCAVMASAAFYNLGRPQFSDVKSSGKIFVHTADMRVYYPVAKYWKELRYDGLYLASIAAYVDDDPNVSLESLSRVQFRSLSTHRVQVVAESKAEINGIRTRFSPARWEAFKTDMRYFRQTMGVQDYLGTMVDHGANATPVWMTISHLIFAKTTANDWTLTLGGLLDPLLLIVMFIAIARTFGVRTALVSVVVFGANDFYMFGTNWGGATLRHDWMAYLGLGLCALKKERWALGGAMLTLSASIRAFPVISLFGASLPMLWFVVEHLWTERKLPTLAAFREANRPWLRIMLGAIVFGAAAFLISSLFMSFRSWPEWAYKVYLLNRDPHVNHLSLRGFIAGSESDFNAVLNARWPVLAAGMALFTGLATIAARRKPLHQAAAIGLVLIPIIFHPANYYSHFVFLLPLIVIEARKPSGTEAWWPLSASNGLVWVCALGMCAAQFATTLTTSLDLHFYLASALLMVTLGAILVIQIVGDLKLGTRPPEEPIAAEPVP